MIRRLLVLSFTLCALGLIGCSSVQKDYDYMSENDYQRRTKLTQSLVAGTEPMSEAAIQKILSSRVALPKKINLAIVRLSDSSEGADFQTIDKDIADQFYNRATWGGRVQSIIPVPQMLLAKPVTLTSLRQSAVLLQADALIIVRPVSFADWKYQLVEENKAKAITSLEVVFLDTRTGVVPYTSLITETAEILKEKSLKKNIVNVN